MPILCIDTHIERDFDLAKLADLYCKGVATVYDIFIPQLLVVDCRDMTKVAKSL